MGARDSCKTWLAVACAAVYFLPVDRSFCFSTDHPYEHALWICDVLLIVDCLRITEVGKINQQNDNIQIHATTLFTSQCHALRINKEGEEETQLKEINPDCLSSEHWRPLERNQPRLSELLLQVIYAEWPTGRKGACRPRWMCFDWHLLQSVAFLIRVKWRWWLLPPSGITLHSVFDQSQTFQILTKHIGKIINNYETKYMQYENIFYDNSNDGYIIL
jgi:hypothetical protein